MKQIIIFLCAMGFLFQSFAQQVIPSLDITTQKTTSLIFPAAIKHTDRGNSDVLVQQPDEADNVLLIKASKTDFTETNLSVITADGNIYSFLVNYKNAPGCFIYHVTARNAKPDSSAADVVYKVAFTDELLPEPTVKTYAKGILDNPPLIRNVHDIDNGIKAAITGIYIRENVLFLQLAMQNQSSISYDIDLIRFAIKDQKRSRRTASQEKDIQPIYSTGNKNTVEADKHNIVVFAMPKFTIPEQQYLSIEVLERNGGRHLSMKLGNNKITRAKELPAFE
jgi:conjugative transposon TraN protein